MCRSGSRSVPARRSSRPRLCLADKRRTTARRQCPLSSELTEGVFYPPPACGVGTAGHRDSSERTRTPIRRLLDVIGNKDSSVSCYRFSRRFRFWTRRLCRPVAASIAASEVPSLVLRSTSLAMRDRFTPAMACSTRTRTRDSARLARRWPAVSPAPRGFFFRPAGLGHRRLVPLEPAVLVQHRVGRVGDGLVIGDRLVVGLARVSL